MNIKEFKAQLSSLEKVEFVLDHATIPVHFHITEVGVITKDFIDCGGTVRQEMVVSFQLWVANDIEHRLEPKKLLNIISVAEDKFPIGDLEIEIEYQTDTIGKYGLEFENVFILTNKKTDCLAKDKCGIIPEDDSCSSSGCC